LKNRTLTKEATETNVEEVVMANKEAATVVAINAEASEEATEAATVVAEEATEVIVEATEVIVEVTVVAEEAKEEIEAAMVVARAVLLNNATVKTPALSVTSVKKLINAK